MRVKEWKYLMEFKGFSKSDFKIFQIDGLEARMKEIQSHIQPKFKAIGDILLDDMNALIGSEMHVHIARHARRTVNPPNDTWMAFAGNKRGYKKHPHFQIGMWDDHLFMWLAFIYELPNKVKIAENFIREQDAFSDLPNDFMVSLDHMKKDATALLEIDLDKALERFRTVKKAEFLIGRTFKPGDQVLEDPDKFIETAKATFEALVPFYRIAYK